MSDSSSKKGGKKTKLEKIYELQGQLKVQKEENRRLKKEISHWKEKAKQHHHHEDMSVTSEITDGPSVTSAGGTTSEDKLKEALKSLKRVTVKQEMSINTLRQKSKQRRSELEQKDKVIEQLRAEIQALKKAHEKLRGHGTDDLGQLRARVADLELQLAKEDTLKKEQSKQLEKTNQDVSSLRNQLDFVRGRVQRVPSSRSLNSNTSSVSALEDLNRLKRELAHKTEKIVNLEFDLEAAREQIEDLKQKQQFETEFPATPAPGADDFFSDEEDDDDFWGN